MYLLKQNQKTINYSHAFQQVVYLFHDYIWKETLKRNVDIVKINKQKIMDKSSAL